jgi:hypothetical protein
MNTIVTQRGRKFIIISERELDRPVRVGKYIRAYCHIHGGDHTRSLSLHLSGWGFCFNATCPAFSASFEATVLVAEWNSEAARHLLGRIGNTAPFSQVPGVRPIVASLPIPQVLPSVGPPQWQQHELLALYRVYDSGFLQAALDHRLVRAYLKARRTPLAVARLTGMGYLPPAGELPPDIRWDGKLRTPPWWCNRVIFPTGVFWPDGSTRLGFCGRSLAGWRPGMAEAEHKALLEQPGAARRWLKTWPHGWFGYEPTRLGPWVVLVEGPFDRCALLASGFHPAEVIALVGTGARASWLPREIRTVVLALDGDAGGEAATAQLVEYLEQDGRLVLSAPPPRDSLGKDWSERWSRHGVRGVLPILTVRTRLQAM